METIIYIYQNDLCMNNAKVYFADEAKTHEKHFQLTALTI